MRQSLLALLVLALVASTAAASESDVIEHAEHVVKARLKDPASAMFRNVSHFSAGSIDAVCGEVNSKNSFGGYVGFARFMVLRDAAFIRTADTAKAFDAAWRHFCHAEK